VTEPEVNPTVARRELAVYFRRLREQRGRTPAQLGKLLGVAQSQVSRLDSGARGFRLEDVERLCDWYGLGEGERRRLLALADESRRRAWWQQVDLPPAYRTLIGLERAAEAINEYCNGVIPGYLQTQGYAAAAVNIIQQPPEKARRAVEVRLRRQGIFSRSSPPRLSVVIDEAVLARVAGGSRVMYEQLQHLLDFAQRPGVSLQVIGFETGLYAFPAAQFILLDMGSRLPPAYYSEDLLRSIDSTDPDDIELSRNTWLKLQASALNPVESMQRIARYRDELRF
jgi:transcriptional regulator with XRE-family HTH domain